MQVALVRGVGFEQCPNGTGAPKSDASWEALADLAETLGFPTGEAYLNTLFADPATIRRCLACLV